MRIDELLFGYSVYTVNPEDVAIVAELFLKSGISVKIKDSKFTVAAQKISKIDALLATRVKFTRSEVRGVGGFVWRNRKRVGALSAIALTLSMLLYSTNRVWDIRIEGSEGGYEAEIIEELRECGFSVGESWNDSNLSKIEVAMLSKSKYASWININRRGTVAYVTVIDKKTHDTPEEKMGYSNVVAACDAIIEDITVLEGVAAVEVGQSVKKGDLLISGVIPKELGGGFCYAEGIVTGRCFESVSVDVSAEITEEIPEEPKLSASALKIFGFSINIFKSYRNSHTECDIIETEKYPEVLGVRLPISLSSLYSVSYKSVTVKLSESEMTRKASVMMSEALEKALAGATLLKISTDGAFSDSSYTMTSNIICQRQIGEDLPFSAP